MAYSIHCNARPYEGEPFDLYAELPAALWPLVDTDGEISLGVLRLACESLLFQNEIRREDLIGYTYELRASYPDQCTDTTQSSCHTDLGRPVSS